MNLQDLTPEEQSKFQVMYTKQEKKTLIAYVLWFLVGGLGAHEFYLKEKAWFKLRWVFSGVFLVGLLVGFPAANAGIKALTLVTTIITFIGFVGMLVVAAKTFVDLFTIPKKVKRINQETEDEIMLELKGRAADDFMAAGEEKADNSNASTMGAMNEAEVVEEDKDLQELTSLDNLEMDADKEADAELKVELGEGLDKEMKAELNEEPAKPVIEMVDTPAKEVAADLPAETPEVEMPAIEEPIAMETPVEPLVSQEPVVEQPAEEMQPSGIDLAQIEEPAAAPVAEEVSEPAMHEIPPVMDSPVEFDQEEAAPAMELPSEQVASNEESQESVADAPEVVAPAAPQEPVVEQTAETPQAQNTEPIVPPVPPVPPTENNNDIQGVG
jgi:TM2 domain-containing membrane protein YozV